MPSGTLPPAYSVDVQPRFFSMLTRSTVLTLMKKLPLKRKSGPLI